MSSLDNHFQHAEMYTGKDGQIKVVIVDRGNPPSIRHLTMNDLKEELGDDGNDMVAAILAEVEMYPWLDANCGLPCEPSSWEEDECLFTDVEKFIREHVELPTQEHYAACASWVIATYTPEEFSHRPRLIFHAPTRSGKTRALDTLRILSYRGLALIDPTKAALFRTIEKYRPTILVDEGHNLLNVLRDVLHSIFVGGFDVGRKILRTQEDGSVRSYIPHCFLALATKRLPPEDWQNRAILVNIQEKTSDTIRRRIDYEGAAALRGRLMAYRMRVLSGQTSLSGFKSEAEALSQKELTARSGGSVCLDDRSADIAQVILVPGLMFGDCDRTLCAIADSQMMAFAELRETIDAWVFYALNEVVRKTKQMPLDGSVCPELSRISTRDVQEQLNEDLRSQGNSEYHDVQTRKVTSILRTLGFDLTPGAHNKSYFMMGNKTSRAWGTCFRKYGLRVL